jgi:hypothetical protein
MRYAGFTTRSLQRWSRDIGLIDGSAPTPRINSATHATLSNTSTSRYIRSSPWRPVHRQHHRIGKPDPLSLKLHEIKAPAAVDGHSLRLSHEHSKMRQPLIRMVQAGSEVRA